ncbi:MAG: 2OG-Fe(II) oxygenase, partial [Acidimicrobiales bacterium]
MRDTWEVPKGRVQIDQRRWNRTLLPVLDGLRADLGLPEGCRLKAELHSMLVYAPGQFFAAHQDSEKADGMVGSLVVTLPGAFTGGALLVDHGGERATYRSSKARLSMVAFYADCRHEIRPVRTGYRIVLTYNLLSIGDTTAPAVPTVAPETVGALAASLDEHFTTPVPAPAWRRAGANGDPPSRLVYLLDHEYTARALSWDRLKGSDAARVAAIRAAADRADCEAVLALADVHETWNAFEEGYDRPWDRRSRYRSSADEDEDEDEDAYDDRWSGGTGRGDDYEIGEFIDSEIVIEHWVDGTRSSAKRISSSVRGAEVCATTPSESLRPYASEYEPYMGNYGNTLDRWYRRGAVVLWPRRRAFEVRAEASPAWALGEVAARVRAGEVDEARGLVHRLAPFWEAGAAASDDRGLFR